MTRPEAALIDELEFRSYVHNRKIFPDVSPARWALIFSNVLAMEERLSTGNILDVAQGGKNDRNDCIGVLPCSAEVEEESQANTGSTRRGLSPRTAEIRSDNAQAARQINPGLCVRQLRENRQIDVADRATGNAPVTDGLQVGDEGGGEILSSSPLYLLASEIVDVVTKGYEQ